MRMVSRAGRADLPLHGGRVPPWLASRMAKLGRVVVEALVLHYGPQEFLRRLAHPFWFQSLGAVMGMDWHSSGITTSVIGALKRGLTPVADELGLYVCGGRGRHSRRTPDELAAVGDRTGLDGDRLIRASRLVAKVDSAAVQDGYDVYLHGFVVSKTGEWVVVQQGMNTQTRWARRYHWKSEGLTSFVDAPHSAIEGQGQGDIPNLTDRRARASRQGQLDVLGEGAGKVVQRLAPVLTTASVDREPKPISQPCLPNLQMPEHHNVTEGDVLLRRLHGSLAAAEAAAPKDFSDLLLTRGVGARTVWALAMVAEVVHGAPFRFSDPARFSFAHGGKDGHPYPVPLKVYDETLRVLRDAVDAAKLGNDERLAAMRRLDTEARRLEGTAAGPSFSSLVATERAHSPKWGGRTAAGPAKPTRQLDLPLVTPSRRLG